MAVEGAERRTNGRSAERRTIYDIASRAGVAPATVSRCLNHSGYVGASTRARIEAAVRELDYQPSQAARALAGRRTGIVALAVPSIANPQWAEVAGAMEASLADAGLSLVVISLAGGRERELAALAQVGRIRADGVAISMAEFQPGDFRRLLRAGTHVVSLSRDIADPSIDAVLPDRPAAILLAVKHLADLGHQRIALVHGVGGKVANPSRIAAYRAARAVNDLSDEIEIEIQVAEPSMADGVETASAIRQSGATAIVASGDALAIGVWLGLEQSGIEVPRDCSIVGMDDVEAAALVRCGLTTVALDRKERGRLVADVLLKRIYGEGPEGPCQEFIQPRLVVRGSTAPPAWGRGGRRGKAESVA